MSRSHLRRIGSIALATAIAVLGLTPPAHAASTGSITGTLTDNGAPSIGATVSVDTADGFVSDDTDASGHYTLAGLAPGTYRVQFWPVGHPQQYAYGKTTYGLADVVTVTAGVVTTVNDTVLPSGTIQGVLTDSHGNPVPGAWTYAYSDDDLPVSAVYTGADGSFNLRLLPGSYIVTFSVGGLDQYAPGKLDMQSAGHYTVTADQATVLNEVLVPTGKIAGQATLADGSTVERIDVFVDDVATGTRRYGTAYNGAYEVAYLVPGTYRVGFKLPSGATQYAHDALNAADAAVFTVTADATTTVDESMLATGSIGGRFTDTNGAGVPNVSVGAYSADGTTSLSATTDANGDYVVTDVFPGAGYKVHFEDYSHHIDQWAYGKLEDAQASSITVVSGQQTTVNDSQLPTGSVKITAKDATTGAAISSFYASVRNVGGSTTTGALTLSEIAAGTFTVTVSAQGYVSTQSPVTVIAGQQTTISISLRKTAKIKVKVVDRATGAPVPDVFLFAATTTRAIIPDGGDRTQDDGTLTLNVDKGGTYQVFALAQRGSAYGSQWVGANGGTGDQRQAASITVADGGTVDAPLIKLDKAGKISGKVTSAGGLTVIGGTVDLLPNGLHSGGGEPVNSDGTYTVSNVGPYSWQLFFTAENHAAQWSNGTAVKSPPAPVLPRRPRTSTSTAVATATTVTSPITTAVSTPRRPATSPGWIKVTAGQTATFNYAMKVGVKVTITVPGVTEEDFVDAFQSVTGDPLFAVIGQMDQGVTAILLPGTSVRFVALLQPSKWCGGADFAHATTYTVTSAATQTFTCVVS